MYYKLIKITDNRNPQNFYIDISKMKDARIRLSILKSDYKNGKIKNAVLRNILGGDFSFFVIKKGDFKDYQDIKYQT